MLLGSPPDMVHGTPIAPRPPPCPKALPYKGSLSIATIHFNIFFQKAQVFREN